MKLLITHGKARSPARSEMRIENAPINEHVAYERRSTSPNEGRVDHEVRRSISPAYNSVAHHGSRVGHQVSSNISPAYNSVAHHGSRVGHQVSSNISPAYNPVAHHGSRVAHEVRRSISPVYNSVAHNNHIASSPTVIQGSHTLQVQQAPTIGLGRFSNVNAEGFNNTISQNHYQAGHIQIGNPVQGSMLHQVPQSRAVHRSVSPIARPISTARKTNFF